MALSSIYQPSLPRAAPEAAAEIGRRVRRRRLATGLTQAELAAPYTRSFISALEQGRSLPSLRVLWLISARLGVEVGELVDGVNPFQTPE